MSEILFKACVKGSKAGNEKTYASTVGTPIVPVEVKRRTPNDERVGILTSGGDCQGLNATIRAVAKHFIISLAMMLKSSALLTATEVLSTAKQER